MIFLFNEKTAGNNLCAYCIGFIVSLKLQTRAGLAGK